MLEKISLLLADESGNRVRVREDRLGLEIKLDFVIGNIFTEIVGLHNQTTDEEIKLAEKFRFADHLSKFLEEYKNEQPF